MKSTAYFLKVYHPDYADFLAFDKNSNFVGMVAKPNNLNARIVDPAKQETIVNNCHFNKIFSNFLQKNFPENMDSPKVLIEFLKEETGSFLHQQILDAGAGNGVFLKALKNGNNAVVGLDIVRGKNAKRYDSFIESAVEHSPLQSNFFDLVVAVFLFEHVCNVEKALLELIRVTKSLGKIVIVVPSLDLIDTIKTVFGLTKKTLNPEHFRYFGLLDNVAWCYNTKKFLAIAEKDCKTKKVFGIKICKTGIKKTGFKYFGSQTVIVLEKR